MKHTIYPCIWFDGQAAEAATLYCSVFKDSAITQNTPMVVNFTLGGQPFMGLNGGPQFKVNPSISFFAICDTEAETDEAWAKLLEGGSVLMPLDKYPWSEKYGWLQDRFGVSWQIAFGKLSDVGQRFTPSLMFVGEQHGKAEKAIEYYTSVFDNSSVTGIMRYEEGEGDPAVGTIKHAQFTVNGYVMMAMDSSLAHAFAFNEAVSLVVTCDTQEEIDYYWNKFSDGGKESMCGWVRDRFGVWWQVIPAILGQLMSDPQRAGRVVRAFMQMKKFDIKALEQA